MKDWRGTEIEFVNDWSELEAAIEKIDDFHDRYTEWDDDAWRVITHYVPRLLTQYASLLETSFALTEGWEKYVEVNPPTGLYLP